MVRQFCLTLAGCADYNKTEVMAELIRQGAKRGRIMQLIRRNLSFRTNGAGDLRDITAEIADALRSTGLRDGVGHIFVVGSTAAVTSFEFEPGLIRDMQDVYHRLAPQGVPYAHDQTWQDDNGFSHVRAALQGPSLTVPFGEGTLLLGTWQQVVVAEFDTRPRQRTVIVTFIGI